MGTSLSAQASHAAIMGALDLCEQEQSTVQRVGRLADVARRLCTYADRAIDGRSDLNMGTVRQANERLAALLAGVAEECLSGGLPAVLDEAGEG